MTLAKWSVEGSSDDMSAVDWACLFREYSNALIARDKKNRPLNDDEKEEQLLLYFREQAIRHFPNLNDTVAKERMCALLFEYTSGVSNIEKLTSLCEREKLSIGNILDFSKPESNLYRALLANQACWNSLTETQCADFVHKCLRSQNVFSDPRHPFMQLCAAIPPEARLDFFTKHLQTYVSERWVYNGDPSYGDGERNIQDANALASVWGVSPAQLLVLAIRNSTTSSSSLRYRSGNTDNLDMSIISKYLADIRQIWSFSQNPRDVVWNNALKDHPDNGVTSIDTIAAMMYAAQPEFILCTLDEVFHQKKVLEYAIPENVNY